MHRLSVHFDIFSSPFSIADRRSSRRMVPNESDACTVLNEQVLGAIPPKSRLLKQLKIDLCSKQIVPRIYQNRDSSIGNVDKDNDGQNILHNLRNRISEPAAVQHTNKRKTKGKVRLHGACDLNPNLWLKSTRSFFQEELLVSPIHKLIDINKKAMLAFQEPTHEPAATKTKTVAENDYGFSNDQIQNDFDGLHTDEISHNLLSECIDYEEKITSFICTDENMNENIKRTPSPGELDADNAEDESISADSAEHIDDIKKEIEIVQDEQIESNNQVEEFDSDNDLTENETNDVKMGIVSDAATSSNNENFEPFHVGQLVWAQLEAWPFWPAIVCLDNNNVCKNGKFSI